MNLLSLDKPLLNKVKSCNDFFALIRFKAVKIESYECQDRVSYECQDRVSYECLMILFYRITVFNRRMTEKGRAFYRFVYIFPSWHLLVQIQQWRHQNNVFISVQSYQSLHWHHSLVSHILQV